MGQFWVRLIPACLVGGCSLIYNPNNITARPDATDGPAMPDAFMQFDARVDTPPPVDANPSMLAIDSVYPGSINEGAGDGGSRPALIVIHGKNMTANATVQVTGVSTVSVASSQVSADGNWMAVLLHATVDMTNDSGTQPLTITVSESGASPAMLTGALVVNNLPQFPSGSTIDASTLAPLYSQVTANNVTFTGDATHPVIIKSVSSIMMGTLTLKGGDASGNTAGTAGPGGCAGGGVGQTGGCSGFVGGGGGGAGNTGGGGGGFATAATAGSPNNTGGAAGAVHGNPQLVNLVVSNNPGNTNQASGGGGGGGGSLLTAGGAGGGGGGTIQLDAGGTISVTSIAAGGGKGGTASSIAGGAGGGGGGAGGVVIVRSAHGTVSVAADAGPGTAGAGAGGGGGGGAGALGRIRIDAPTTGAVPTTTPAAHRGPMFATATPQIVTNVNPMVTLYGEPMDVVDGYDIDATDHEHEGEPKMQTFATSTLQLVPAMLAGYNKLCFTLQPGVRRGDLADTCIEIAYLP